ncbi:16S rRNA (guanine(966)-N(2))-methyltransferase RsmD [Oenococcus sp.]|uniref:16S rRNA (guanine(966)-N(2))-methyltransferase RsmD n=1 Tax=Oenococcus sp. TaxID=1979414 RepID=UPI0039E9B980
MRVVAGKNRGMRLKMVASKLTRPTTDKVKEALFSIITPYIKAGLVLDLYAGSGALGIEAVSRGYAKAYLVDHARPAIEVIRANAAATKNPQAFEIMKLPASQALTKMAEEGLKFDLLVFDPPYAKQHIANDVVQLQDDGLLAEDALLVAETDEHGFRSLNDNLPTGFTVLAQKNYGMTYLTIFKKDKVNG